MDLCGSATSIGSHLSRAPWMHLVVQSFWTVAYRYVTVLCVHSFPRGVFPSFATRKIMTAEPRILALGCRFLEWNPCFSLGHEDSRYALNSQERALLSERMSSLDACSYLKATASSPSPLCVLGAFPQLPCSWWLRRIRSGWQGVAARPRVPALSSDLLGLSGRCVLFWIVLFFFF